ncbi:MAG: adenylate/guanylate cyclase domain-containing protein [Bacteroidales bacterium]|nr:adenylate/guanylate cyclase domain-containing protein [Bacteroidales bacterium]MDD7724171.1 adenylate/guanylate cyclase domain-containing protein [Bacteroidales bacterium]MDY4175659.1 adenylate/guanylate cyclase domain-containing protein [Bacteroidales bacterium]
MPQISNCVWRSSALAAFFCLTLSCSQNTETQQPDVFRVPQAMLDGAHPDTAVSFSRRYMRMAWDVVPSFEPTYTVTQISASGDTIFSAETSDTWFAFMTSGDAVGSTLTVQSASGSSFRVATSYGRKRIPGWVWTLVAALGVAAVAGVGVWFLVRRHRRELELARKQLSETESNVRKSRKYEFATVLFTDIQGFTKISAHTDPEKLVDELDRYFIYFDELVEKYGVEKIKTIGDSYMCAGGVPDVDSANPIEVVLVGLEMIAYIEERRASKEEFWNIRVGINTGPVMSAYLGNIKKVFDIWGDTVNTASRMESGGEAGRVNISESTYQRVRDFFECEYRGKMPVKYKGEMDMYFVKRLKEEYCQQGSTCKPNDALMRKLQILRIHDFEERVRKTILADASANVTSRFDDILSRIRVLASLEGFSDDETIICGVATIFCFVHANFPKDTTLSGKNGSEAVLAKLHMSEEQREDVRRVVIHHQQGKNPDGRVEEVIADAFNEVYGRKDLIPCLLAMHEEAVNVKTKLTTFLSAHRERVVQNTFYTNSARHLVESPKNRQIEILDEFIAG